MKKFVQTYNIITFGCAMNRSDSERIAAVLESAGYRKSGKGQASTVLVLNACSVRQSAIDRIYGQADLVRKLKIENWKLPACGRSANGGKIVLTGCVLPKDKKAFSERFDLVFNIRDLEKLPRFLKDLKKDKKNFVGDPLKNKDIGYFHISPRRQSKFSALVPISFGCNRFCSYCAVPYTRGLEVNRPAQEIIKEVKDLIAHDCKEIWLLGQTVSSWRDPQKKNYWFLNLLRDVEKIPGKFWVRFESPYVLDFDDKLIAFLAKAEKVNNYLNLPLQSGDDVILRKMNRKYTVGQYLKVLSRVKGKVPGFNFSTDVIVGFCEETNKQFQNTYNVFKKMKPAMAFIAKYSPRPGTLAAKTMSDSVSLRIKKARHEKLTQLLRKTAKENMAKEMGKVLEVLAEIWLPQEKECLGKTRNFKTVRFRGDKNLVGQFVKVKITHAREFELEGKLI